MNTSAGQSRNEALTGRVEAVVRGVFPFASRHQVMEIVDGLRALIPDPRVVPCIQDAPHRAHGHGGVLQCPGVPTVDGSGS